jgi:hypothetical protein
MSIRFNLKIGCDNLAPKAWISQREVGESSKSCWSVVQMVKNHPHMREGMEALL